MQRKQKARIAHLAGPTATIQNTPPLVTSNKARKKYGLPLRANPDGSDQRFDVLRARFEGADPEAPLSRGYAIVTFEGRAVRDASSVPDGAAIEAKVQRGRLHARVEKKVADG